MEEDEELANGGVDPAGILRMKFIDARGLFSERGKRPAAESAEGGNGCCAWVFGRDEVAFAWGGADCLVASPGKIGMFGWRIVDCMRRETRW